MAARRTLTLSAAEREQLVDQLDHDPRPYMRERAGALLKIADGRSPCWVARHGLLRRRQPRTVYGWLNDFEELRHIRPHQPRRRAFSP